jgi:hypothetical protein
MDNLLDLINWVNSNYWVSKIYQFI